MVATIIKSTAILLALGLTACQSAPYKHYAAGERLYANAEYEPAKQHYYQCAAKHVPKCFNKMGMANYKQGNTEEAIKWFVLGARFDDEPSKRNLSRLKQPIPAADLANKSDIGGELAGLISILGAVGQGVSESPKRDSNRGPEFCDTTLNNDGRTAHTTCF